MALPDEFIVLRKTAYTIGFYILLKTGTIIYIILSVWVRVITLSNHMEYVIFNSYHSLISK